MSSTSRPSPDANGRPERQRSDTGYAPSRWQFDDEVTRVFDNMLERSIPQYGVMRRAVHDVACRYIQPGTDVVDLGCSRGEAISTLVDRFGDQNRFVGVEVSDPMLTAARKRFADQVESGTVQLLDFDLRSGYPDVKASVTLCVLALQFVPIEHRQRVVRDIFKSTVPGGALVLVEKALGNTADIDALLVDLYYDMKKENGYSEDEIERKRLSLEGVLVPVTAKWNEELLCMAGFTQVDCFWRWMNFAAWIAIRG
ncbi:MAG: methyltransferase domain-containing protein [Chloroflexi bacterium]|nr:methyltransferase domain-containing protein [Chloroflexota bacterium]